MPRIDIIVPVKNEAGNIEALIRRTHHALDSVGQPYQIIFIDDHSTDKTFEILSLLKHYYPLQVYLKQGKPGKAYSIIEGVGYSTSEYLVMIDGDLQYPPEKIPEMVKKLTKYGIVVARREDYQDSALRRLFSHTFTTIFGKLLHGFECDVQSGLKAFRKDIISNIDPTTITPWTLDLSLLITALDMGYSIGEVKIAFSKRDYGKSKVNLIKTSYEIGLEAIRLKFRDKQIFTIRGDNKNTMTGSGFIFKRKRFVTHTTLPHHLSALNTFLPWQSRVLTILILTAVTGLILNPLVTLITIIGILTTIYFLDVVFSLYLILKSLHFPPEINLSENEIKQINDKTLPIYTILCPLYKEATMLPHFLQAIENLDWPKSKLDVLLLLEENDHETIQKAKSLNLPSYIRKIIVPHSEPKTKPKACNFGLSFAKGEYLVIFDAEDKPEPAQLKKAFLGFQKISPNTVCLQAKLNYYNPQQNLLTKLFTAEYSLWFDVILTGLQSIDTAIPLGGTSNHFRLDALQKLKGWDPFNVTEDCDLGVRIFHQGYKTAIINSTTLEEANSNVNNWLRQRSRWIKGYMQTYFVHMRNPLQFVKQHGFHVFLFQLIIGTRISFMLINPILWAMTIAYFAFYPSVGSTIEKLYLSPIYYMAVFSLIFGNFIYIYNYMIGLARKEKWELIKYVYIIPLYWLLASIAAFIAFYQLITKPHYWEKTLHGLHLKTVSLEKPKPALTLAPRPSFIRSLVNMFL